MVRAGGGSGGRSWRAASRCDLPGEVVPLRAAGLPLRPGGGLLLDDLLTGRRRYRIDHGEQRGLRLDRVQQGARIGEGQLPAGRRPFRQPGGEAGELGLVPLGGRRLLGPGRGQVGAGVVQVGFGLLPAVHRPLLPVERLPHRGHLAVPAGGGGAQQRARLPAVGVEAGRDLLVHTEQPGPGGRVPGLGLQGPGRFGPLIGQPLPVLQRRGVGLGLGTPPRRVGEQGRRPVPGFGGLPPQPVQLPALLVPLALDQPGDPRVGGGGSTRRGFR